MPKSKMSKQYALPGKFWIILAITAIVVISSIGWFLIWRSGWPGYLQALNECGGKPPVEASTFITSTYYTPGDDAYRIPEGVNHQYFCSETEAKAAGYKHGF